jgi:uncharacterized membrane protein YesL
MLDRFKLFFSIFFGKIWKFMELNLLTLLLCLPIVTIGPAIAGMTKVLRGYYLQKGVFMTHDFFKGFRENWKKSLPIGLLDVFFTVSLFLAFRVYPAVGGSFSTVLLCVTVVFALGVLVFNFYAFPMIIATELRFREIVMNALVLTLAALPQNIITLIILGALTVPLALAMLYNPFWIIIIMFIFISLTGFIAFYRSYPVIRKYIIDPFYEREGKTNPEYGEDYDLAEVLFSNRLDSVDESPREMNVKSDKPPHSKT